jgi:biopolymer transport protein TolR
MTSGVSVDLPKTNAQPINNDSQPLTVSVRANGDVYLQDEQVPLEDVVGKLKAIASNNPDRRIFVRGDKDLPYGRIMQLMGIITQGGFTHVALLAEQTGPTPATPSGSPSASPSGSPYGAPSGAPSGAKPPARTGPG